MSVVQKHWYSFMEETAYKTQHQTIYYYQSQSTYCHPKKFDI